MILTALDTVWVLNGPMVHRVSADTHLGEQQSQGTCPACVLMLNVPDSYFSPVATARVCVCYEMIIMCFFRCVLTQREKESRRRLDAVLSRCDSQIPGCL